MNFNSRTKYMCMLSEPAYDSNPTPAPIATYDAFRPGDMLLTIKGAPEILQQVQEVIIPIIMFTLQHKLLGMCPSRCRFHDL